MKNITIKSFVVLLSGTMLLGGCSRFEEMNKNNNALQNTTATTFVQPTTFGFQYNLVNQSFTLNSQLMQYTVAYQQNADKISNYRIQNNVPAGYWNNIYYWGGLAHTMLVQAEKDKNRTAIAIADILKALIISSLTDAFGDIPYSEGLKGYTEEIFTPRYDTQKSIYKDLFRLLEQANQILATEGRDFTPSEDYMYGGKVDMWRKFGNSIYARLLMRVSLKDEAEGGELGAVSKLNELFSYPEDYPVFESRSEAANVGFDQNVAALQTPFYAVRKGLWDANMICERLMDEMYDKNTALNDPRLAFYFDKFRVGVPTQITYNDMVPYFDIVAHYSRAVIQNRDYFPLMNYSELLFIQAEAAYRGWISGAPKDYYTHAVSEAVREWNPDIAQVTLDTFLNNVKVAMDGLDGAEILERILTQKWISNVMVGIESWCDYRRTGYPEMPTKSLAGNDGAMPTRLRYPADEEFRNRDNYLDALNSWLGGVNNMTTNVWWADHASKRK